MALLFLFFRDNKFAQGNVQDQPGVRSSEQKGKGVAVPFRGFRFCVLENDAVSPLPLKDHHQQRRSMQQSTFDQSPLVPEELALVEARKVVDAELSRLRL